MPELFAILLAAAVAGGIFLWAVLHGRTHGPNTPEKKLAQLLATEQWLIERYNLGRAQGWDSHNLATLEQQLLATQSAIRQLTEAHPSGSGTQQ